MDGRTIGAGPAELVCHCLLVELPGRLVLVDTGFGRGDVDHPVPRLHPFYLGLLRPRLAGAQTAAARIRQLGLSPAEVTDIVLTHLDFDHAGGIEDFPRARVHVLERELQAACRRRGFVARGRYRPMQWDGSVAWEPYGVEGEPWFGFSAVRDLKGLPPEILMVPLAGHTAGHAGIAIDTGPSWLLHAGDAYFFHEEMNPEQPRCPIGLRGYQALMEVDRQARLANQHRLRRLVRDHGGAVRVFCAHDRHDLDRLRNVRSYQAAA
jgi:glyoxylase-like metal-dependent hydrolase (beta-lactamase superfamily II)